MNLSKRVKCRTFDGAHSFAGEWTPGFSSCRSHGLPVRRLPGAFRAPYCPQAQTPSVLQDSEERGESSVQKLTKLTLRSDLVLVPVIVTDKSGKPRSGLQKDSFSVEENGKPQSIFIFEEMKTESLPVGPTVADREGYSNFTPGTDRAWRINIVVLDLINTPSMRQLEVR